MAVRYAWECPECQATIELTATQAGQEIKCASCLAVVTVPKLGVVKALPVVGDAEEPKSGRRKTSGVNPVKSWLFAGGLLIAVLAGIAGGAAQYRASEFYVDIDTEAMIEDELNYIDEQEPAEIYAVEVGASDEQFGLEYTETPWRTRNIKSGIIQKLAWAFWGIAGAGVLMLLSSFMVRK